MNKAQQQQRLKQRYRKEKILLYVGRGAVICALIFLFILIGNVIYNGWRAVIRADIALEVTFDEDVLKTADNEKIINYVSLVKKTINKNFPEATKTRKGKKEIRTLFSELGSAQKIRSVLLANPDLFGQTQKIWVPAASIAEGYYKGIEDKRLSTKQQEFLDELSANDDVNLRFNYEFFVQGDSRSPELAGIGVAIVGSFFVMLITFLIAFPVGVAAAIYLEQFAPKNKWLDLVEININNLAAVPSIIMGLLGLAIFLNLFGMPRSSSLVGGVVLALMTIPTIIISSRAAIKAVPPRLIEGAMSLGATRLQAVTHQVLPVAAPGILTGSIIGMAQALGETAPLLMVGMVAFIVSVPQGITDPATVLPVQIFLWADQPERGYVEKTSFAICVLLAFLLIMNASAIYLRKKLELKV